MTSSWRSRSGHLPIMAHLDTVDRALDTHRKVVVQAPPGSGKTTVLPLHLLEAAWLQGKKILMLQPRRIAAKGVAARMADLLQEPVGERVGFRIRLESKVSSRTKIELITEGLLTRKILSDPELSDIGLIVLDEFHERSIHADLGLALALETQSILRPDLRLLVMSATIGESGSVPALSPFLSLSLDGRPFPVTISYCPPPPRIELWERMSSVILDSIRRHEGDVLAFLPGAFEIEKTNFALERARADAAVFPLFGDLPYAQQQRAIEPDPAGRRKIVLATPIAETSLTIEGIKIVIDSGLHKVPRGDSSGVTRLRTERISRDAADQRAGRAGRTAPGLCVRLWSEQEHLTLRPSREPEVLRTDLTPAVLDLAAWGVRSFKEFGWVTQPPDAALASAIELLQALGALDKECVITPLGKTIATVGTHPRLARMAIAAGECGAQQIAAAIIPVLEERDLLPERESRSDINERVSMLLAGKPPGGSGRLIDLYKRWRDRLDALPKTASSRAVPNGEDAVGFLLAVAFPDRIGRRREVDSARYLLSSGIGATLRESDPLKRSEFIVVAEMHDATGDGRILLAAPLNPELFERSLAHLVTIERTITFDVERGRLRSVERSQIGAVLLRERECDAISASDRIAALTGWLGTAEGFARIPFGGASAALRHRIRWVRDRGILDLPDVSDAALMGTIEVWLAPFLGESASLSAVTEPLVHTALESLLTYSQRSLLEREAPTSLPLPSGKVRRLEYSAHEEPILEATVQELFGLQETPTIGTHRTPVLLHILSPARRPMQVTRDLAGFWRSGYQTVRKELRGRYPKHKWPEDPSA